MNILTTTDVYRLYTRSERERLQKKYRKEEPGRPYFWQFKGNPDGSDTLEDKVRATMRHLDALMASTIRRYGTDWSKYDRETVEKRLRAGKSVVVLPRDTGCYALWPDAQKPEFPHKTEYDPGVKAFLFQYYCKEEKVSGLRYFYVNAHDFYILESEEQCNTFMSETPTRILWHYAEVDSPYTIFKRRDRSDNVFEAICDYDYATEKGTMTLNFDTFEEALAFVEEKKQESIMYHLRPSEQMAYV